MSLTLWHRDRLLGSLFIRSPSRHQLPRRPDKGRSISAVLLPVDDRGPDAGLWQLETLYPAGAAPRYRHLPLEPDIVAARHLRQRNDNTCDRVALRPLTPEERAQIRPVPELSIRNAAGERSVPRQLRLEEMRLEPEHYAEIFREIPSDALIGQSIWLVSAAFAPGVEAPAT